MALEDVSWMPADVIDRLCKAESGRINNEKELIIISTESRSQVDFWICCIHLCHLTKLTVVSFKSANIKDCYAKLQQLVDAAVVVPKERKMRKVVCCRQV